MVIVFLELLTQAMKIVGGGFGSHLRSIFPPFPVRGTCFAKLMNETWYLHGSPCVYAPAKEEVHPGEGGTSVGGEMGESGSEVNHGTCGSNPQNRAFSSLA